LQQNALQQQKRITTIIETSVDNVLQNNADDNSLKLKNSDFITASRDDAVHGEDEDDYEIDVELNIMAEEQEEYENELYKIRTTLLGMSRFSSGFFLFFFLFLLLK
jgi:hypothetical protein